MRLLLTLVALVACAGLASALTKDHLSHSHIMNMAHAAPERAFQLWAERHGKAYATKPESEEHRQRLSVFQQNLQFIRQHEASGSSMKLALNEFADLTWEEFSKQRLGFNGEAALKRRAEREARNQGKPFRYASAPTPETVDWRKLKAVTDVKNQGQCGSCWSFSATGAIEGINAIRTGELVALSEQQLVDCDTDKNQGCNGGLMDWAYDYVIANGGIDTEEDYNYWSGWGLTLWTCNRRKQHDRTVVTIDGYEDVPKDEESLLKAVAHQPISVGICAGPALQFYSSGVLDKCCEGLNHGVLASGYGKEEDGTPYWLVKNSWGGAWGMEGYFKLKRGVTKDGLCGIATAASFPTKNHDNPPVPKMCDVFGWTECPAVSTCSCSFNFFNFFCLWHDCCPLEGATTCDDNKHCCPGTAPVCDTQRGMCISDDGTVSVPWTEKIKANVASK